MQGQKAMVRTTAEVWKDAPQRAAQAIDRLMAHRVVDGLAILRWAFDFQGLVSLQNELATGLVWEVIYNAVNKTLARTQVCTCLPASPYLCLLQLHYHL